MQLKKIQSPFLGAVALFTGTAIGAGIFGLPYTFSRAGFFAGFILLVLLGVMVFFVTLAYGEVVLSTKEKHQLIGYAGKYLQKKGKILAWLALFIGIYSALIAYTIEVGIFLNALVGDWLGGNQFLYSILFLGTMSIILFLGIQFVAMVEKIMVVLLILTMTLILIRGIPEIQLSHLVTFQPRDIFLPYGVILFALGASSAIPAMREVLAKKTQHFKKALMISSIIPFVVYGLFALVVVGVTGQNTTESAILGLADTLGPSILFAGTVFGILAMTTSFVSLSFVLKEAYTFDFHTSKSTAWCLVMIVPFIVFIADITSFIQILGLGGAVIGGFEGILIIAMHQKAKKFGNRKPEYSVSFPKYLRMIIYGIFGLGILYQILLVLGII